MATRKIVFSLFFFICILEDQVLSIYEDQVGLMDWHHKYIGKVNEAIFHTQKPGRKCVIVSTEENVIASLDLRHGDILWRHVLGIHDTVDQIGITLAKYVVTLSSMGGILRSWNIPDGQMVWEAFLDGFNQSQSLLSVPVNLKNNRGSIVVVYSRGYLHAISGIDGVLIWKNTLGDDRTDVHHLVRSLGDDIHVVGLVGTSGFVAHHIDARNGDTLSKRSGVFPGGFSRDVSIVIGDLFVAFDAGESSLVSAKFRGGGLAFHETEVAGLIGGFSGRPVLSPSKTSGVFFVKTDSFTAVVRATEEGDGLEAVDIIGHPVVLSDSISLPDGREFVSLVRQKGAEVDLVVKCALDWDGSFPTESVEVGVERGGVRSVFVNNYVRTDRSHGFRVLVVMEDHSLLLVQQGEVVWRREDGLATVVDVTTCDAPVRKDGGGGSIVRVEKSLLEWLQVNKVKLKAALALAGPTGITALHSLGSSGKAKADEADWSGKLIIVLTKPGKLFGLRVTDGSIVWSVYPSSLRQSEGCTRPVGVSIHQWRAPHQRPADVGPSVVVLGRCGPSTALSFIETYTGTESASSNLPYFAVHVISLAAADSSEHRLFMLIDGSGRANLYPRSPEARGIFVSGSREVYWYSVDPGLNAVRGYVVETDVFPEVGDDYSFRSRELWSVVFPPESEGILGAFTRNPNEVVHTQAKATVNDDVVYKHVSKNVVFIATGTPPGVDVEESRLVAYVVDTVTGRILHSVAHPGSRGPVHAVFSENWIIYHYFNVRAHRNEMSVIEIYDRSREENKDVWKLVTGNHNLTSAISSFSWREVAAKSHSYFFTHSVKTMAVTLTAKGITSKQVLIGTVADQVLALDKRLIEPPQSDRGDEISTVADVLQIKPEAYVTHGYKVEGMAGIAAFPAELESTTYVFAYGVDLFMARIASSKTYDSLTEDFGYALLLFTILALAAAILATWIISQRNDLHYQWR